MIAESPEPKSVRWSAGRFDRAEQASTDPERGNESRDHRSRVSPGDWLEHRMREKPATTLLVAAALGILAGWLTKWRR
jgi:hypothetical protein